MAISSKEQPPTDPIVDKHWDITKQLLMPRRCSQLAAIVIMISSLLPPSCLSFVRPTEALIPISVVGKYGNLVAELSLKLVFLQELSLLLCACERKNDSREILIQNQCGYIGSFHRGNTSFLIHLVYKQCICECLCESRIVSAYVQSARKNITQSWNIKNCISLISFLYIQ